MSRTLSTLLYASILALVPACGGHGGAGRPPTLDKPADHRKEPTTGAKPLADPEPPAEPVPSKPKGSVTDATGRSVALAAPPPTAGLGAGLPAVTFTFSPKRARAGQTVTLTLSAPLAADVYFGGKKLAAREGDDGRVLRVTLPKSATTNYFELRVSGRTFKATTELVIE